MISYLFSNLPNIMYVLFLKISDMGYKAIIPVLFVIVARLLIKDMPKWIRYFLWMIVFISLVLPLSIPSPFSIYNLLPEEMLDVDVVYEAKQADMDEVYGTDTNSEVTYIYEVTDEEMDTVESDIEDTNYAYEESITYLPTEVVHYKNNPLAIIALIWILGIFSFVTYFIISTIKLRKRLDEAVLLNDNVWSCDNVDSPFVLGVINPKIYLSSSMDKEHVDYVIMHEKMHMHSKDQLLKYIAFFLLMIYWMNPVIWIAYILFCRDIEFICDENVIKNLDNDARIAYTKALLACSTQKKKLNISPIAFGEIGIKNRIKSVLEYKKVPVWLNIVVIAIIAGLGVSLITVRTMASSSEESENEQRIDYLPSEELANAQSIEYLPFEETENVQATDYKPSENDIDVREHNYYSDNYYSDNWVNINPAKVDTSMSTGADGTKLYYADKDIFIFGGYYGLFVYDMNEQQVIRSVDLSEIGCDKTQGDEYCEINVTAKGDKVFLHIINSDTMYVYDVENSIMTLEPYDLSSYELYESEPTVFIVNDTTIGDIGYNTDMAASSYIRIFSNDN